MSDPDTPPGLRLPHAHAVPLAYLELDQSPLFGPVERHRHAWEVTYTAAAYRELLLTYSTHLALPDGARAEVVEVGDRREALRTAVALARPGDTLLVAGKGHETCQEVAGEVHPFDDREVLRECLAELGARA